MVSGSYQRANQMLRTACILECDPGPQKTAGCNVNVEVKYSAIRVEADRPSVTRCTGPRGAVIVNLPYNYHYILNQHSFHESVTSSCKDLSFIRHRELQLP